MSEDKQHVKILKPKISANDPIEILQFGEEQLVQRFGSNDSSKDILNGHYKRLDDSNKYKLAQDPNWWDTRIELVDASTIEPVKRNKFPVLCL